MLSTTARLIIPTARRKIEGFYHAGELKPGDIMWRYPEEFAGYEQPLGLLCCPFDGQVWTIRHDIHHVIQEDPLTLAPSFICPVEPRHHFFIREGRVIPC